MWIRQFFSLNYADRGDLFEGLSIWEDEKYRRLQGESIESRIDEQIVYGELSGDENAIWSLLLAGGYLKTLSHENYEDVPAGLNPKYELDITNHEVERMFKNMVHRWFSRPDTYYNDFVQALLQDDIDGMNDFMELVARNTFSFFDTGKRPSGAEPERFYHGFVLGLIVDLQDRYTVTSNRESGFGRYDVMLEPIHPDADNAIIMEFKVFSRRREETLEDTMQAALRQIEEKQYDRTLIAKGFPAERIRKYGFAFEGKNVLIGTC